MATKKNPTTRTAQRNRRLADAKRSRRAMAQENPAPSATVKGNGNGGDKPVELPGLTAAQRKELAAVKSTVPTVRELLQPLQGVGKKALDEVLAETEVDGNKKASQVMRNRAHAAPQEKAGLRGKALAMWVVTGKSDGAKLQSAQPAATTRTKKATGLEGDAGRKLLIEYLNAQVSSENKAPAEFKPTVDENGKLRIKSAHFRTWLASKGHAVGNVATVGVLRDAGLEQERWFTLPRGQRMCYVGKVPTGTKKLPVRKDEPMPGITQAARGARARGGLRVGRVSDVERQVILAALTAFKPVRSNYASTEAFNEAKQVRTALADTFAPQS